jgi:glucan phosphoethanolaminetransferase (alkaline phosphatase superfamily)
MQRALSVASFIALTCVFGLLLYTADPYVAEFPAAVKAIVIKGKIPRIIALFATQALCLITIMFGLLHRSRFIRWLTLLGLLILTTVHAAYSSVLQHPMSLFDFEVAGQEKAWAGDALQAYRAIYIPRLLSCAWFLIGTILIFRFARPRFGKSFYICLPLALVSVFFTFKDRNNLRVVYPSIFSMPALYLKNVLTTSYYGPRDKVSIALSGPPKVKNIIYLIDESIRGDMLSINGNQADTTPYLKTLDLINFGVASSSGNCSKTSNVLLRSGVQQAGLPDNATRTLRDPSIFQYARQAGYRTVYIEGQIAGGNLQDYMTRYDLADIDDFFYMDQISNCDSFGDCFPAQKIAEVLKQDKPSFILVVKAGAHVPYQKNYPAKAKIFAPDLGATESMTDRPRTLNSYYNAIRWSVDDFFAHLIPQIKDKDYMIMYTSDHGQNILENGSNVTHCSKDNAPPTEGNVPLLMFGTNLVAEQSFRDNLLVKAGHATHYDIFPSILWLMGFDEVQTRQKYGASLRDPELKPQQFYAGSLFDRKEPSWNLIATAPQN